MPTKDDIGKRDYIGDGVYVSFNGFHIILKANSLTNPTDEIALEDSVFLALIEFAKRINFAGLGENDV